jgi:hypothetical protein
LQTLYPNFQKWNVEFLPITLKNPPENTTEPLQPKAAAETIFPFLRPNFYGVYSRHTFFSVRPAVTGASGLLP